MSNDVEETQSSYSGPNETVLILGTNDRIVSSRRVLSTYAAMVDSNKGSSLNFIPATMVNGFKCAKITREDVTPEIEYWQMAVICSVPGSNHPLDVIEGFLRHIWQSYSIDKISLVRPALFLVRFHNLEDHQTVVKRGVFFFYKKPLLVKAWNPEVDLKTDSLSSIPIWVQLHDVELKH